MILVKTPLRISFVGGRTDIEDFYSQYPGRVISTTIDKNIYISVSKKFAGDVRVSYSETENVANVSHVKHTRVKAVMEKLGIDKGIEITSVSDIPSEGTGLASSSAFTVGLLQALYKFNGEYTDAEQLAQEACEIEINKLGEKIGKQDQYAVAYGGLNLIEFSNPIRITPIHLSEKFEEDFENYLMFFYTGKTRFTKSLLDSESQNFDSLKRVSDIVPIFHKALLGEDLKTMGELLNETWMIKRSLRGGISNPDIDRMYELAMSNGAWGGKILGAGGGGFLMLMVEPYKQYIVREALKEWREVKFEFTNRGSEIVYENL